MNIYVGNLSLETTEDQLREAFSAFGNVVTVKVVRCGTTGESRGYGFVGMPTESEAKTALEQMNGSQLGGSELKVEAGRSRPTSSGFGGGGKRPGGGGGGRRGGSGRGGPGRGGPGRGRF